MNNRFDPRTIFLSTIFFTVSLIMMKNINQIIFFIIVIIIHILFVGINVGNILKIFLASIWLLLSIIFINYFLIGRDVYYILNTASRLFFIIILAAVMLSSIKTAIAMEIRGYNDSSKKTRLYESSLRLKDYVYILFSIACFFLNFLLRKLEINIF